MKRLTGLSLILVLLCTTKLTAQTNHQDSLKYFVVLYTVGEAWDNNKEIFDQPYMEEHSKFLSKLRKEKTITMGARYSSTGMIILKAKDLQEATSIMDGDVSVKNKLFRFELYEMDVFYEGCVE
jgi:hypothetical protein